MQTRKLNATKYSRHLLTHAKQTVWQTSKLLQKRSLRERHLFSLCKSPLNIYLC
jgi:hypothetical protein